MIYKDQTLIGFPEPLPAGIIFLPAPIRLLDTRSVGASAACYNPAAVIGTDTDNFYNVRIRCTGIPPEAKGIFGNITLINMAANGFITLYPKTSLLRLDYSTPTKPVLNRPFAAAMNYRTAIAVQNQTFLCAIGKTGEFGLYNTTTSTLDAIIDLVGFFI